MALLQGQLAGIPATIFRSPSPSEKVALRFSSACSESSRIHLGQGEVPTGPPSFKRPAGIRLPRTAMLSISNRRFQLASSWHPCLTYSTYASLVAKTDRRGGVSKAVAGCRKTAGDHPPRYPQRKSSAPGGGHTPLTRPLFEDHG